MRLADLQKERKANIMNRKTILRNENAIARRKDGKAPLAQYCEDENGDSLRKDEAAESIEDTEPPLEVTVLNSTIIFFRY